MIKEVKNTQEIDPRNNSNPAELLDALHIQNMFSAIHDGASLNADIDSGHKSTLLVQLGNIAQRTGRSLNIDPNNGHILQDSDAQKLWGRAYENGWEMKL